MWCGGLLWLVVSAVVYRCDLMFRLIKLHTRGCVGSLIRLAGCMSIGKYVARTSQWTHNQPAGSDCLHSHGNTPHVKKYH